MKKLLPLLLFFTLNSTVVLIAQDDANFKAGENAYNSHNYSGAEESYTRYIKTFEAKLPGYLKNVNTYDTSNTYQRMTLLPNFSINHSWAVAFCKRGLANLHTNNDAQANKDFDMAIQIDTKYAEPYLQKGLLLKAKGRSESCRYLSKAKFLSDTMKAAKAAYQDNFCWMCSIDFFEKGKTQVDLKQYAEGLQNLNQAIVYCHDSANYYAYRGIAYEGLGKLDSAVTDYSYAIKLDSNSYMGYYRRALTYEKAQKYKASFADLARVLVLNPKFSDAYMHQALDCEEDLNLPDDAVFDYEQVIRLKPAEGIAWYKIGLHKKQHGDDACSYFQKAVDLGCDDAQSYVDDCKKEAEKNSLK